MFSHLFYVRRSTDNNSSFSFRQSYKQAVHYLLVKLNIMLEHNPTLARAYKGDYLVVCAPPSL